MSDLGPLHGVRIWLSGAVPETAESTEVERKAVVEFVEQFATLVFRQGGYLIHGSHPSFTPVLLQVAKDYEAKSGRKDCLTLVMSRFWSKNEAQKIEDWSKSCTVYETPEASEGALRDESLKILRRWMAARCDAFVAVGGKWWSDVAGRAGVPAETRIALERGVPCFLLGGLGGAARDFVRDNSHLLSRLKNGFDEATNHRLALESEVHTVATQVCDQLKRLPLVRGRVSDGSSFRILALDGGGIKGTFTAAVLATWEQLLNARVVEHFDMIAGTSTGGIIAIGLGLGLPAQDLLRFYRDRGTTVFPLTSIASKLRHSVRHVFRPKFSQATLLRELEAAYYPNSQRRTLKDSKCRLVIPTYHALGGAPHVFRTPHHPLLLADAETDAAHAALATAAAPTYFSAAQIGDMIAQTSYFDGGVWANNPAMAAIVEAVCYLRVNLDRIDILSVGTTGEAITFPKKVNSGIGGWGMKLIKLFMSAQDEASLTHARLLAEDSRFLRVNAMAPPGTYGLDSAEGIGELAALGQFEAQKPEVLAQVRSRFLNGVKTIPWKAP